MPAALKTALNRLLELDIPVLAGGLAFYGVLSVFPTIALTLLAYGFVSSQAEAQLFARSLEDLLPHHAHRLISEEIARLSAWAPHHFSPGILIVTVVIVWSSMAGWKALISGIRVVAREDRPLTLVGYQARSLVLSFLFIGAIITSILLFFVLIRVLGVGASPASPMAFSGIDPFRFELLIWGIASIGIYMALVTIYRTAISRARASLKDCAQGAAAGTIAWFLAISAFDFYAEFANWRTMYGALTGVIAFLLWFYVSAYAALFGAAYASSLAQIRKAPVPAE